MHTRSIRHLIAAIALGFVLLRGASFAEPPADKGKGASASQAQGASAAEGKGGGKNPGDAPHQDGKDNGRNDAGDKGKGYDDGNHGRAVSECNHRANERKLQGQERKEFVEWCTDHGERYQYDDKRFSQDRSCYRRADERNLSGDFRRVYLQECLRKQEKDR